LATLVCLWGVPLTHAAGDVRVQVAIRFEAEIGRKGHGPGEFLEPGGLAVDALGNLYVADTGNDRVQKLGRNGGYLSEAGGFGWAEGQFNRPSGIATGRGLEVFVADSRNARIQVYTTQLDLAAVVGGRDAEGPISLGSLAGIALTEEGVLYVSDTDLDQIVQITTYSRADRSFGGYGYGGGSLRRPMGLAVGERGAVYVCDSENDRVCVFDAFGNYEGALGEEVLLTPAGVCAGPEGTLFVADTGHHRVVVFDPVDGEVVAHVGGPEAGQGPGAFDSPRDVAVDEGRTLYVADTGNGRIQRFFLRALRR